MPAEKPKDKSLDDQLKEAQIVREQAETAKLKAEEALVSKQVNAKWYSGKSLAQITALVLTVVAVYTAIDKMFLAELKQKEARLAKVETKLFLAQVDSLNREKERITTTIDSLKIRATISAEFGNLDSLKYAHVLEKYNMIIAKNYYDRRLNPGGAGKENKFELQRGDSVVYDAASGLTWQQSGSRSRMIFKEAQNYINKLNQQEYAGYSDWRLPTLEEAMLVMEPKKDQQNLHIDPFFDKNQFMIWVADKPIARFAWFVNFSYGNCELYDSFNYNYVRAVR